MKKIFLSRAVTLVFGIVLAFLVAELGLRLFKPQPTGWADPVHL
jgi:hypothetical protein